MFFRGSIPLPLRVFRVFGGSLPFVCLVVPFAPCLPWSIPPVRGLSMSLAAFNYSTSYIATEP
jgi:hypothetical protein